MYTQDMARTHRFQILFTEEEAEQLKAESERRGIPMAEIIRDYVKGLPKVSDSKQRGTHMPKQQMTKAQAVASFKKAYADYIQENRRDITALNTAWHMYTDSLCKDGMITIKQYESWDNPKW